MGYKRELQRLERCAEYYSKNMNRCVDLIKHNREWFRKNKMWYEETLKDIDKLKVKHNMKNKKILN